MAVIRRMHQDPQAWLTDVLGRIAEHKITKLDELLSWRYAEASAQQRLWSRNRAVSSDGYVYALAASQLAGCHAYA